jgi:hypothetical protein
MTMGKTVKNRSQMRRSVDKGTCVMAQREDFAVPDRRQGNQGPVERIPPVGGFQQTVADSADNEV